MGQPTLEPKSERIIANFEAALAGITQLSATQTYWYTIPANNIHRVGIGYPTLRAYPALVVELTDLDVSDERESSTESKNTEQLSIQVNAHLKEATNPQRAMQRILRDIRIAVMQDATRGALAQHTFVTGADFFPAADSQQNTASVVQAYFRIEYYTLASDLEVTPA